MQHHLVVANVHGVGYYLLIEGEGLTLPRYVLYFVMQIN